MILLIRRSESLRSLAPAILLAAVTSSLLAACFGVPISTVTVRPYGAAFPWLSVLRNILIFLYIGFGIGAALATLLAIPAFFVTKWFRSRSDAPKPPPLPGPHPEDKHQNRAA
jgi:hypothetical protein